MRLNTVVLAALLVSGSAFGFDLKGVELGKFASHEQLHQAGNVLSLENYSDATHGRLVLATKGRIELIMQRANEI